MKSNIGENLEILLLGIIFIIIFIPFINAFAISSAYGSGYPLEIHPGEIKDIQFGLMTSLDENNLVIKVELVDNSGVASLIDPDLEYKVNVGEIVPVNLRVSVNKTAKTGEEHNIVLRFSDITPSEGEGSISFKGSSTINLNVLVVQPELKETKKGTGLFFIFGFFLLIAVISIILVIWLVVRNRKN